MFITLLIFALIIAIIILSVIKLELYVNVDEHVYSIKIFIDGIKINRKKIPKSKKKPSRAAIVSIVKSIRIKKIKFDLNIGTDDAAQTVYFVQGIRTLIQVIYCLFYSKINKKKAHIKVLPMFERAGIEGFAYCIITLTVGNIIIAYINYYVTKLIRRIE